ncbi:hypothetical protein IMSAGC016_01455 [Muribaculaceae bacterium]|nr:hypothetical protein IMSAGC016_01455 [Muribaculaceae bacterium]
MSAYQYVDLTFCEIRKNLFHLFGFACPGYKIHPYRQIFKTICESVVMLHGKYCGWHKHSCLLPVGCCFEGGADSYFRLSETDISTYQSVHRFCRFHVCFYRLGSLELIWSVLIYEACLKLMLHIGIRRKRITFLLPACGIEFYQITRNILDLGFCAFLELVPCSRTEFVDFRRDSLFTTVF